jgi:hypothetical protein
MGQQGYLVDASHRTNFQTLKDQRSFVCDDMNVQVVFFHTQASGPSDPNRYREPREALYSNLPFALSDVSEDTASAGRQTLQLVSMALFIRFRKHDRGAFCVLEYAGSPSLRVQSCTQSRTRFSERDTYGCKRPTCDPKCNSAQK